MFHFFRVGFLLNSHTAKQHKEVSCARQSDFNTSFYYCALPKKWDYWYKWSAFTIQVHHFYNIRLKCAAFLMDCVKYVSCEIPLTLYEVYARLSIGFVNIVRFGGQSYSNFNCSMLKLHRVWISLGIFNCSIILRFHFVFTILSVDLTQH